MLKMFDWLGIKYDEGIHGNCCGHVYLDTVPIGPHVGGAYGPYIQVTS